MDLSGLSLAAAPAYLWHRLPLLLLFAGGYLVYRLLAVTMLTDAFVDRVLARTGNGAGPGGGGGFAGSGAGRLLLFVMLAAALLSLFLPNAVTVLAMLPALKAVDAELSRRHGPGAMTTALALAVIYGANIGGMGSLIGSPANLMLVGALDLFQVPGREAITFLNWMAWAAPLAALLLAVAWGLAVLAVPKGLRRGGELLAPRHPRELTPWQRSGLKLFVLFVLFWVGSGLAREVWAGYARLEPAVASGFFLFFSFLLFFRGGPPCQGLSCPLLRPADVFSGLPLRGLGLLAVLGLVVVVARHFRLDEQAAGLFGYVAEAGLAPLAFTFALLLAVVLLTEAFSNTIVAAAFFPLAFFAAGENALAPLPLMVGVSIASTCAFMTPVATPCNALAFGEMRGVRLSVMLGLGLLLNLAGAALMALWVRYVVAWVYAA
jgi:sodium-dependent dicarboxylate transporter 2/3/5